MASALDQAGNEPINVASGWDLSWQLAVTALLDGDNASAAPRADRIGAVDPVALAEPMARVMARVLAHSPYQRDPTVALGEAGTTYGR